MSNSHYPTLFIALLMMVLLLALPLIYPRRSFRFSILFQVFTLGMALLLLILELYQALMKQEKKIMKYAYSLCLVLGSYLLYSPGMDSNALRMLYLFLVFASLSVLFEYVSAYAFFRAWLHRWFQEWIMIQVYILKTQSLRSSLYRKHLREKMRVTLFKALRAYVLQRSHYA